MAYAEGQISGGSGAVVADILAAWNTAITGTTGWSQEYSSTSGVYKYVWKCDHTVAGNSLGVDFYVCAWGTGSGPSNTVFLSVAEGWNSGTTSAEYMPIVRQSTGSDCRRSTAATAASSWPVTTNNSTSSTSNPMGIGMTVAQSGYWFLNIHNDRITAAVNSSCVYAGAFESLVVTPATNDPVPLGVFNLNANSSTSSTSSSGVEYWHSAGAATRWAMNPSLTLSNFTGSGYNYNNNGASLSLAVQTGQNGATVGNNAASGLDPYTGDTGLIVVPILIHNSIAFSESVYFNGVGAMVRPTSYGVWRGKLKGVVYPGPGFLNTVTIDTDTYVGATSSGGYAVLKG